MDRLTYERAYWIAFEKYGDSLGMFGRLLTNGGNRVPGKYISHSLNKIITKEELLEFKSKAV